MKNNKKSLFPIYMVLLSYILMGLFACIKITEKKVLQKEAASILETPDLSIYSQQHKDK